MGDRVLTASSQLRPTPFPPHRHGHCTVTVGQGRLGEVRVRRRKISAII